MRKVRSAFLVFVFTFFIDSGHAAPQIEATNSYIALLRSSSLAEHQPLSRNKTLGMSTESWKAEHALVEAKVTALGGIVTARHHRLLNAVRFLSTAEAAELIAKSEGVLDVRPSTRFERQTSSSVPFVGATSVWAGLPTATGKGVRMGIVDSGIDYLHANFGGPGTAEAFAANDSNVVEPGTFPTAKVVGGYDFVGSSYNADSSATAVPYPDADPLDCGGQGHGTHVAGIAAGQGVLVAGGGYSGPYNVPLTREMFLIGPGVAPEAELYALKVFGCGGSTTAVLEALEWAADPNGDGDFSDRLDVVNLSLGSPFGLDADGDPEQMAVNRLVQLGCVVVASAGNNGNATYVLSSPSAAESAISVANAIDEGSATAGIHVVEPIELAGFMEAVEGAFTLRLSAAGQIEAEVALAAPADACGELENPGALMGKIALVDRGTCFFTEKVRAVQNAGALAVLVVNNVPGPPITMGGTPDSTVTIPGLMVSQADGERLKRSIGLQLKVRLAAGIETTHPEYADQLDSSSSRGPAMPANRLKPDIAAPGHVIASANSGSGNGVVRMSGTSMAAPHVSGAAALLRQLHPEWQPLEIKAALMNTAAKMRDANGVAYPETLVGAGRLDVRRAALLPLNASATEQQVALNFGQLTKAKEYTEERVVRLRNHAGEPLTVSVSVSNTAARSGFDLVPIDEIITVPGKGTADARLRLTIRPGALDRLVDGVSPSAISGRPRFLPYETTGQVWFHGTNYAAHVPFFASARAGSEYVLPDFAEASGEADVLNAVLSPQGQSSSPGSLVSVFQLGWTNARRPGISSESAPANLKAVGVATDARARGSIADATLFFGIATHSSWCLPSGFQTAFTVEIDRNLDGSPDYALMNRTAGNGTSNSLNEPGSANDVYMAVLRNETTAALELHSYTGWFPPGSTDTALYNNSVLVLPVPAKALGLTNENSSLRYRVISNGPDQRGRPYIDGTPWIGFDVARPAVDASGAGVTNSPFYLSPNRIPITFATTSLAANGFQRVEEMAALVLFHHNTERQAQVVYAHPTLPRPALSFVEVENGELELRWNTGSGTPYQVESSVDLGVWQPAAGTLLMSSPESRFRVTMEPVASVRYFRLRKAAD